MKRFVMCLLGAVMALTMFGCGNGEEVKTPPVEEKPVKEELDMTQFPYYIEPSEAKYEFGTEQMVTPYFKGNVIYNETVLLVKDNKGEITGKLQYNPVKVLSVRDYTWKNEYSADEYTVEGNVIKAKPDSSLPYWTAENLQGKNMPEQYRQVSSITNAATDWVMMGSSIYTESSLIYGHQISVSYVYDLHDLNTDEFAKYETSGFTKLKAKLSGGEDVKLAAIGDSVAEGCSSSKHFNHEPFMDNWVSQVTEALDNKYDGKVTVSNLAVGGMTSTWGSAAQQINSIVAQSPDMVMIHFGINDCGGNASAGGYSDNIEQLITGVLARLPECEFMLIKAFPANLLSYNDKLFRQYWAKLDDLAKAYDGVYTLDMYTLGSTMLKTKKYMDVTGNGINHVNDYSSRLYTMNILSALIKY